MFNKRNRIHLLIGSFFCLTILIAYPVYKDKVSDFLRKYKLLKSILSSLAIPVENTFLKRPALIKQIEDKFKDNGSANERIQTVTLVGIVGMGGVGKTTLARYYARSHGYSISWEINAETKESLINSFKDLALALAKTKDQKEDLEFIQSIKDIDQREKEILNFVKNLLKSSSN